MHLLNPNDNKLREPSATFDFNNPPFDPIEFSKDLVKFMYDNHAIGVSAVQVGVPYRIFSMRGHPENYVCFNPKIVSYSSETVLMEESSITWPGLAVKIKRPYNVRVRFLTPNGQMRTEQFQGMTARIIQHHMDHMVGDLFYNHADKFHRDQAFRKWEKIQREQNGSNIPPRAHFHNWNNESA